ncbi:MAG: acyl-CoA dehydrogenase [Gemmatimonadota bacterium]|jgi:acyl-CoA oxidase
MSEPHASTTDIPAARPAPESLEWPSDHPETLTLLPLVYVAWSDGVLTEAELRAIRERIDDQAWLDAESRERILAWLDPGAPPSPSSLARLRERVAEWGSGPGAEARRTLVELGVELARSEGVEDGPWERPEARGALDEIEEALGVVGHEAARSLVARGTPPGEPEPPPGRVGFDATALADYLDRPYRDVRRRVLALLADPAFEMPLEMPRDVYRERVLAAVRRLAEEGIGALAFDEEHGGSGDPGAGLAAFETLAFGDLSVLVKFGVQFGLFGGSIQQLGTGRHHRRWLRDIGSLELPGCFAMTEGDHGSNVRGIETEAVYDPETDELVVHTPHEGAGKDWIGNAALHGRLATVFAQLRVGGEDHGVHAVVVPIRDDGGRPLAGVRLADRGPKEGLDGVDNGQIWFDRVRVPRENLLDRFGRITDDGRYDSPIPSAGRRFFTTIGTLVAGRISIAAASVSAAKTGLTIAVRYSARRRQFGPSGQREVPVLEYLTQQRLLLPRLAATYGLHFACRELSQTYAVRLAGGRGGDRGEGTEVDGGGLAPEGAAREEVQRRVEVEAAGLKAYASRHCVDTLQACREALGGRGYDAANRFGRLKADTDVFTTFEGANVVLLQLVARGLLSAYGEQMGDLRLWDMVKYLAERAGARVRDLNPVVTRRTDEEHLRDPELHRSAFEYREERLLTSVARRLRSLIEDGVDSFEAMNLCQDHLVTLAGAHVERRVLAAFHEGVKRAPSPGTSEALRLLSELWALERLEAHRGWYLESGFFEGSKSKAVRDRVNALCREVADVAVVLVDGFGIPDAVLRAPAGLGPS